MQVNNQIVSFFNINNNQLINIEESPQIIDYIEFVIEFLDEIYEQINDIDGEYEPVNERKRNIRNIKQVNSQLGKYKKINKQDVLLSDTCSICCDNYKCGEYKRELPCSHVFHKKCIDKWLCGNDHCPICRVKILNK